MEDIKFIKKITSYVLADRVIVGNCIYYNFENGNRAKTYCEETGVVIEIINKLQGKIDSVFLPFANYFEAVQCDVTARKWYQHIDKGYWYFENMYKHCLPKDSDYIKLAKAMMFYMNLFK